MKSAASIEKETGEHSGRYVARIDGVQGEAEISFASLGARIRAEHTHAPETMRGTGAARALVEYMVSDARKSGFKIIPVCPYVRAQFEKHPDWQDVVSRESDDNVSPH
jgi:predicted GNAT family acetyltransferase